MTEDRSKVSDDANPASGDKDNDHSDNQGKGDTVGYQTYKRTVGEVKRFKAENATLREELEAYRAKEKQKEDEELERRGEFDKIKANLTKELEDERAKNKALLQERVDNTKLGAFLSSIEGSIPRDYWGLIDTDRIAVDPDTGVVDEMSVTNYAKEFKTKHARLIDGVKGARMYEGAPQSEKVMDMDAWKKLPLKERKAKLAEVYAKHKDKL